MIYKFDGKTMEYIKIPHKRVLIMLLLILISCIGLTYLMVDKVELNVLTEGTTNIEVSGEVEFTREHLICYIEQLNIAHPEIVLAQAQLETGDFTSKIFMENNNLFGMKEARQRGTTALGTQYNHAYYNNWRESVLDYALYSNRYLYELRTDEQYLAYLGENYAEDTTYVQILKRILKNNAE